MTTMKAAQTQSSIAVRLIKMDAEADASITTLLRVADAKGKEPTAPAGEAGRILDIRA
jgi:hypothetical protein